MRSTLFVLLACCGLQLSAAPSLEGKNVLFVYGGWDGHDPEGCLALLQPWMESEGARVFPSDSLGVYADSALMDSMDLIVQIWTMGHIKKPQLQGLLRAVRNGTGFAGWHGGAADAFRQQPPYQFMVGGQWVSHPGGKIDQYEVNIVDHQDPVTYGVEDFSMKKTENYYMHVDPNVKVLAAATFTGEHAYWIDGATMPVVWKKYFGKGRIFYTAIGHFVKDLEVPEVFTMLKRGFRWAAESKYRPHEPWIQPVYGLQSEGWTDLFPNGDFRKHWDVFMGVPLHVQDKEVPGYTAAMKEAGKPIGLNKDPLNVFTLDTVDGEPAIRISGEVYACLTSKMAYEDYHFQWQFKWGEHKWAPRLDKPKDSGILYHCTGEHGQWGKQKCWMSSVECQVELGDCGEYWSLVGSYADIAARKVDDSQHPYAWDPKGEVMTFAPTKQGGVNGNCQEAVDREFPEGEWNTMDIYVLGDRAIHLVNGHVVLALQNIRRKHDDQEVSLTRGYLQIQSEAAEIYYKGLRIHPITRFPDEIKQMAGF